MVNAEQWNSARESSGQCFFGAVAGVSQAFAAALCSSKRAAGRGASGISFCSEVWRTAFLFRCSAVSCMGLGTLLRVLPGRLRVAADKDSFVGIRQLHLRCSCQESMVQLAPIFNDQFG